MVAAYENGRKAPLSVLVALASYGTSNDRHLERLIREYRSMPFEIDIVIISNVDKKPAPGVECRVGLPSKDPWSLPFAHKKLFAERADRYDLFIYSEDDILITERQLRAFLEVTAVLRDNEIAGFIRMEEGSNGSISFPDLHEEYHWDPTSLRSRTGYVLGNFTNEHAACYVLTQSQLRKAIKSGGFLVEPHEWKHDLLCSAATDPYIQCGFTKLIPIIGDVIRAAIVFVVPIPRGKIDSKPQAVMFAGLGNFADDIPLSIFPGGILYGMFREFRRPKAETIMVFTSQNQALHPSSFGRADDLVRVEIRRVEHRFGFIAVPPFFVREGVDGKMDETVKLHFVPAKLTFRRNRTKRRGRPDGFGREAWR